MINYKEKKMANWRDKTESNETVHASQGKNYKKNMILVYLYNLSKRSHYYYIKKNSIMK